MSLAAIVPGVQWGDMVVNEGFGEKDTRWQCHIQTPRRRVGEKSFSLRISINSSNDNKFRLYTSQGSNNCDPAVVSHPIRPQAEWGGTAALLG